jgi:hypothetical protein
MLNPRQDYRLRVQAAATLLPQDVSACRHPILLWTLAVSSAYTSRSQRQGRVFSATSQEYFAMGAFMKEHDIYVDSLLDQLNLRFAPPQGKNTHYGGLEEMIALQKEFKIFKKGRPFKTSVGALNIGATNTEAKNRLLDYFGNLAKHDSNLAKHNGDVAIVNALIKNLASKAPLPVYFTFHDMRAAKGNTRVLIDEKGRPLPFFKQDYLTVSFPTLPHEPKAKPAAKAAKSTKTATKAARKKA